MASRLARTLCCIKCKPPRLNTGSASSQENTQSAGPGGFLQAFTAIGFIATGEVYQVEATEDFKPYRINVTFLRAHETPIKPLIENLSFIKSKTHWGGTFRFGYLKVSPEDFELIAKGMGVELGAKSVG